MSSRIFISYSIKDKLVADYVCERIEAHGLKAWIAPRDVDAGQDWPKEVVKAIIGTDAFVLILSANSNKSRTVQREVDRASHHKKTIYTVRTTDIEPSEELEFHLGSKHWTDAFGTQRSANIETMCRELARRFKGRGLQDQGEAARRSIISQIGSRAEFYLTRWADADRHGNPIIWNWSASLFGASWLAYRRLYAPAIAVSVAFLLPLFLLGVVSPGDISGFWYLLLFELVAFKIGFGVVGERVFRDSVNRVARRGLAKPPGPSVLAALAMAGVFFLGLLFVLAMNVPSRTPAEQPDPVPSGENDPAPTPPDRIAVHTSPPYAGPIDDQYPADQSDFSMNSSESAIENPGDMMSVDNSIANAM